MITDHRNSNRQSDPYISRTTQAMTLSNGSNTQVAAPGVGRKIVVISFQITDTSGAANSGTLKSGSTSRGTVSLAANGGWNHEVPIECAENEAFVTTFSGTGVGTLDYGIAPV